MQLSMRDDLREFVRTKVQSGEFASEGAVVEAALLLLRRQDVAKLDNLIDHDFIAYCNREGEDDVSLDQAFKATSRIPGSMADEVIQVERADRF